MSIKSGEERKEQLLAVGAHLASQFGLENVTRRMIAKQVAVTDPLVAKYLGNVPDMRKAIAKRMRQKGISGPKPAEAATIGLRLRREARVR